MTEEEQVQKMDLTSANEPVVDHRHTLEGPTAVESVYRSAFSEYDDGVFETVSTSHFPSPWKLRDHIATSGFSSKQMLLWQGSLSRVDVMITCSKSIKPILYFALTAKCSSEVMF